MLPSVRAFFSGIIDYAGLFPPAQLSLHEAIHNYARYRSEPDGWLLGRFVCPQNLVPELFGYGDRLFPAGGSFALAVVVPPTEGEQNSWRRYSEHLQRSGRGYSKHFSMTLERRVAPVSLPALLSLLRQPPVPIFWEFDANSETSVRESVALLRQGGSERFYGFKLRCGGPNAAAVPSVEQVAHIITACRDAGVPLKFTAGLHHPVRRYDPALQTKLHGFLNLFAGGVLAQARLLSEAQIREIVADEDAGHFTFAEGGFAWKDQCASVDEIAAARHNAVISFGSCSFDEPCDDLRKLRLI